MADNNPNQAAQSFSAMVTEWERNFDAFANQFMGTDAYSQAMNEMQKGQLSAQRNFGQMMAQQLAALNMPTRDDIVSLTDMVRQLDRRIERIEGALTTESKSAPKKVKRKRPARTKQPPAPSTDSKE